jgi:hypothetical protein
MYDRDFAQQNFKNMPACGGLLFFHIVLGKILEKFMT